MIATSLPNIYFILFYFIYLFSKPRFHSFKSKILKISTIDEKLRIWNSIQSKVTIAMSFPFYFSFK